MGANHLRFWRFVAGQRAPQVRVYSDGWFADRRPMAPVFLARGGPRNAESIYCSPEGLCGSGRFLIQRIRRKARLDSSPLPNRAVAMTIRATNTTMRATVPPSIGCITPTAIGAPAEVTLAPTKHQGIWPASADVGLCSRLTSTAPTLCLSAGATDRLLAPGPPNRSTLASLIEPLATSKSISKICSYKSEFLF
jgi:hypothetical protein